MKWFLAALAIVALGLAGCTESDQNYLQTQAALLQQTALARGEEFIKTQASGIQQTLEAGARTQVVGVQKTIEVGASTQVAGLGTQIARIGRGADPYLVGAYYYPWYGPGRQKWDEGYTGHPELGEYTSSDPQVIQQQIDWAADYGVDFFAVSWWGPASAEDKNLRDGFLKNPSANKIRFAILYESTGRLKSSSDGKFDLSDPLNQEILLDDFAYLQKTYWANSQYLKIGSRPVIILYLSRQYEGDLKTAIANLRTASKKSGYDLYLIGDEVYWTNWVTPDASRLKNFDAVTSYNMHASIDGIADHFTNKVNLQYALWQVAARNAGIRFIPGVIPGFDDRNLRPQDNHPPIPGSAAFFNDQLDMAKEFLDPQSKMLLITSWNEWLEGTAIEPEKQAGTQYLDALQSWTSR